MGATNFEIFAKGTDARAVYDELCAQATFESGHDPYNGTISTTHFTGRIRKIADKYSKAVEKRGYKIVEAADWGRKRECSAIDLGVAGYEISQMVKVPHTSADAKFQTRYVVYADNRELGVCATAAEARKLLERKLALVDADYLHVEKEARKVEGKTTTTCAYERKVRVTKTKPARVAAGAKVKEIHAYIFYGWASC